MKKEFCHFFHRGFKYFVLLFSFVFFTSVISCKHSQKSRLTIATSANMKLAMKEIVNSFEKEQDIECEMIVGSSGKLTAQIRGHAPFDVFVSANTLYPEELYRTGYSDEKAIVYAYGKLILLSMKKDLFPDLNNLNREEINHIALGNPKTAPYGTAAMEVLKNKKIFSELKDKFVYGESVSQVNQFILSGVAEVGFTAKSVIMSPGIKDKGHWIEIDSSLYNPIAQGFIVLNNRKDHLEEAKKFRDFLISEKAGKILNTFGYSVNSSQKVNPVLK